LDGGFGGGVPGVMEVLLDQGLVVRDVALGFEGILEVDPAVELRAVQCAPAAFEGKVRAAVHFGKCVVQWFERSKYVFRSEIMEHHKVATNQENAPGYRYWMRIAVKDNILSP
jgi:hypothetical protein